MAGSRSVDSPPGKAYPVKDAFVLNTHGSLLETHLHVPDRRCRRILPGRDAIAARFGL